MTPIKPRRRSHEEKQAARFPKKDKNFPNIMDPERVLRDIQRSWIEHDGPAPPTHFSDFSIDELMELTSALPREERLAYLDKLSAQPSKKEAEATPGEAGGHLHQEALPDGGVQRDLLQPSTEGAADTGHPGPTDLRPQERDVLVARDQAEVGTGVAEDGPRPDPGPSDLPEAGGELRPRVPPRREGGGGSEAEGDRKADLTPETDWLLG